MQLTTEGYSFDFPNAIDLFKFDEEEPLKPRFHGAPMKAVDVIAEFNDKYLFIEIKDFHDPDEYNVLSNLGDPIHRQKKEAVKHLKNSLKYKLRDSYLYRHLQGKTDKPIHYICLLDFDDALNLHLKKNLGS